MALTANQVELVRLAIRDGAFNQVTSASGVVPDYAATSKFVSSMNDADVIAIISDYQANAIASLQEQVSLLSAQITAYQSLT